MYNILITSVGRRVELVKLFKRTASKLGINSAIVAADSSNTAPRGTSLKRYTRMSFLTTSLSPMNGAGTTGSRTKNHFC